MAHGDHTLLCMYDMPQSRCQLPVPRQPEVLWQLCTSSDGLAHTLTAWQQPHSGTLRLACSTSYWMLSHSMYGSSCAAGVLRPSARSDAISDQEANLNLWLYNGFLSAPSGCRLTVLWLRSVYYWWPV